MSFDRRYLIWAMGYIAIGMCLGLFMAASHNFAERDAHSHVLLVGFVLSLTYAIIHRLWLDKPSQRISKVQFILHQAGTVTMSVGLFLLYGGLLPAALLEPILGISSVALLAGVLSMLYMLLKNNAVKT